MLDIILAIQIQILKGNLIAISLIGTDKSLRKIEFFGKSKFEIGSFIAINNREKSRDREKPSSFG